MASAPGEVRAPGSEPLSANPTDLDRHFRRAAWAVAGLIMVAAAVVHAGKAADDRSAFIRWRPQVREFWRGVNIYDTKFFPNPPIMPISLAPLTALPPVAGAVCWFALKVGLTAAAVAMCFAAVRPPGKVLPSWFQAGVMLFCLRPVLSDLHHGNNNLVILFLVVAALEAWRRGHDVLAGLVLALAVSYKVTPALFGVYFLWKRQWRVVGATAAGLGLFLLVVPALVIGPRFNAECLGWWWHRMLSPYLVEGASSPQEMNQSMVGVLTRLLTATKTGTGRYDLHRAVNLVALSPVAARLVIKGVSAALVVLLLALCRPRGERRTDPRLLGEFALVVLTMLFLSERSWKHHFVTLLLPYTYLMAEFAFPAPGTGRKTHWALAGAMWASVLLMATTSTDLAELVFGKGEGHKLAQAYGMFFWAAVVLYAATAWRVAAKRADAAPAAGPARPVPAPHFAAAPLAAPPAPR